MKEQVECRLHTKASEELQVAVAKEINTPDRPLSELLHDKEPSNDDRDSGKGSSGAG